MNLPNKLTVSRIILSFIIIFVLLFPFESIGVNIDDLYIAEKISINPKYLVAGVLFIIASLTDYFDGKIARKYNLITDFGKLVDAIADKVLVNSTLIILSSLGDIPAIITVIIIVRDCITDSIKMLAASKGKVVAAIKTGKYKTACLMVGIVLTLFGNIPFVFWNVAVNVALLWVAAILAIISGIEYYKLNKNLIDTK